MEIAVARLTENTPITNFSPGSIARALLEIVNEQIAQFYQALDYNLAMAFVSKAEGYFLDLIGELLNCKRQPEETDDNYRYRICHQVEVLAGCNLTALRLEVLSVPGVRDVVMRPYVFGPGSFGVYAVPETVGPPSPALIDAVQAVLDEKAAYGIRAVALEPRMVPVDIMLSLVVGNVPDASSLVLQVRQAVWQYIAELGLGGTMVITEIVQRAMDVSDAISDVKITYLYVDDRPAALVNQECLWDELFYPRLVEVS